MEKVLSICYSGLYVLLAGAYILLAVLSRGEELPPYARDPPVLRPLRRMARRICRRMRERRQGRQREDGDFRIPGAEGVRCDLQTLYPVMKAKRQEVRYRQRRWRRSWPFCCCGSCWPDLCISALSAPGSCRTT